MFEASHADLDHQGWQRIRSRTSYYTGRRPYRATRITDTRHGAVSWLAVLAFGLTIIAVSVAVAAPNLGGLLPLSRADRVYSRCTESLNASLAESGAEYGERTRRRVNGTFVCEALRDECRRSPSGSRCRESIDRL